jgi:hypothetical protein
MTRAKVVAVTVAAAIAFSSATATAGMMLPPRLHHASSSNPWLPWVIIGCATMIVMTAVVASNRNNRQLTSPEAMSCGILYWFQQTAAGR